MALKMLRLTPSTTLVGTGGQTAVAIDETPIAPGFNAVVVVGYEGGTGAPVVQIQSTDAEDITDVGATWTTLAATSGIALQQQWLNIEIPAGTTGLRTNKSVAGGAGTFDAVILGGL